MPDAPCRPDLMAGLSSAARRRRERADAEFIRSSGEGCLTAASALEVKNNTFAGVDVFKTGDFKRYQPGDKVDCVVCARIDLDHPIYFADNKFCPCADCGCDLQFRPHTPAGPRLCICCAARRMREAGLR